MTCTVDCRALKDACEPDLLKKTNVVGTGVGVKMVNGVPTGQPAILVFVEKKMSTTGILTKFSAIDLVPESIDGIPTDVIEVGKIVKQEFRDKVRPLKPGYSVGHGKITAGTIGGFFFDRDGDPVILSNCHVLANEGKAAIGDIIYQPGPLDARGNMQFVGWNDPITNLPYAGTLKRFVGLKPHNNTQDSGIALIHEKIIKSGLIDQLYPTINRAISGFGDAAIGMQVQKCGRTTGYTTGRVMGMHASFTVGYDFGPAQFNECIVLTAMSNGGDSGSVILDLNMNAVGLLFAGSPKVTLANPFDFVRDEYGLQTWSNSSPTNTNGFDKDWHPVTSSGSTIDIAGNKATIKCPTNNYCFLQRDLHQFRAVTVTVHTGTDKGASWGPGLVIQWPAGILKVNLRVGATFGGYYNTNANLSIGQVQPASDYKLRIRKSSQTLVGEVQTGGQWVTVIEIPQSLLPTAPICVRLGKTDEIGQPTNHSAAGDMGECCFSDLVIE